MEVILLERIEKLGQMGDVVNVKPGYARNFLLPQSKALRATEENRKHFESQRAQLEAANLELRGEAEAVAKKMEGLSVILVRQAGEAGQLYGSVNARDIADSVSAAGFTIGRQQIGLAHPIKSLGLFDVSVSLHPEVSEPVIVNVARSEDEAKTQAKTGKAVTGNTEEDDEAIAREAAVEAADEVFEKHEDAEAAVDAVEELADEEPTEKAPAEEAAVSEDEAEKTD